MIAGDWSAKLLETLLGNALTVGVLALGVFLVGRWVRNPAVRHTLWAVVLLRALMPPVIPVPALPTAPLAWFEGAPVEAPRPALRQSVAPTAPAPSDELAAGTSRAPSEARGPATQTLLDRQGPDLTNRPRDTWATSTAGGTEVDPTSRLAIGLPSPDQLGSALLVCWLLGSVVTLGRAGFRLFHFRCRLGTLESADGPLSRRAAVLAERLGLVRCPEVSLTECRLPPLVWAPWGRARIILPRALVERLSSAECETVLAHELAHIARRDHWLRALELASAVVFWWHPGVAWARGRLRECEEAACDQRVLTLLPEHTRAYAEALLETLDLTARPPAEPDLPAMASGLQSKNRTLENLEGRLQMILDGKTSRPLPWHLRMALALTAALALLVLPTRSLEAGGDGVEPGSAAEVSEAEVSEGARDLERKRLELEEQALEIETEARRAELERLREATVRTGLRQELRVRELEARLEHARETADANEEAELVAELEAARTAHEIEERERQLEMERMQTELELERRRHVLELDTRRRILDEEPLKREEVEARRREMVHEMLERRQHMVREEESLRNRVMQAEREQLAVLQRRLASRGETAQALALRGAAMAREHETVGRQMELQRLHIEAQLERHRLEQEVEAGSMTREQADATLTQLESELEAKQQDLLRAHIERRIEEMQHELPMQIAEMRRQLEESGVSEGEIADSLQALRQTLEEATQALAP